MIKLEFESRLNAPMDQVWAGAVTMSGIAQEMPPITRMQGPPGIDDLRDLEWAPGEVAVRSKLLAFGFIPIGSLDLMLTNLEEDLAGGRAQFVEQSQMTGMRSWRHQRDVTGNSHGCTVTDTLTFEPEFMPSVSRSLVSWFFRQRHKRLRKTYGVSQ